MCSDVERLSAFLITQWCFIKIKAQSKALLSELLPPAVTLHNVCASLVLEVRTEPSLC